MKPRKVLHEIFPVELQEQTEREYSKVATQLPSRAQRRALARVERQRSQIAMTRARKALEKSGLAAEVKTEDAQ